ncbi:sigma 54-interacting response regulator [Chitinophaga pinensis]|uniref:Sigma54 specific transcriptional regulator, Fis family n=1 Tax=Chitinophaga pinensis (strain ATCC 43595 / DSM 2588 / LMG 13176 / NBRC 15968 / NCIMB 11800 / UQM 2034) TaxID=485918 RepID=A0A979GMX4_CHIPD|nr:sigma 54-interacting response regulator [Chitinophaga pinensis]ACU57768.1 sigma54 specific transcriptional regulator, Fis family [Chitinophaga pinensis DSM 2588]
MTKKVLIVEDEFIVASNLKQVLERSGYEVIGIAASAQEAEEHLQRDKPDIVLLDIRLQGERSGIDIARKLKSEHIAFVYLSANSNQKILEEAKMTYPDGFLVKPYRKKDLLIMLDIAWYRHAHSLETKNNQEIHVQKQITEIITENSDNQQKLLKIAEIMQTCVPFDLITSGLRPLNTGQYNDKGYLRVGFDEYQFIGEKELLTITNLKRPALSVILANSHLDINTNIYNNDPVNEKPNVPSLQKTLIDTFNIQSYLVFPVVLSNGQSFHYFFYSRQKNIYTNIHISLLDNLRTGLATLAEKMIYGENLAISKNTPVHYERKLQGNTLNYPEFRSIIGNHHLLLGALDLAAQVAFYNTSVLILGESGTGKEKLAQAIHLLSPRKNAPFITVNCAAIPVALIESELFGHEKGAFTGAIEKRKGKFEQADGGTIFLDEIGELSPEMQVKILRFLQEKEIQCIGGNSLTKVNVRVIAATNRNLEKEVAAENFRLDLYYRINVFPITLPSLRERRSDIKELSIYFAEKFCSEFNKPFHGIVTSMMEEMIAYDWPGNIRELENVIEQSAILNDGKSKLELKRTLTGKATIPVTTPIKTFEDVKNIQAETEREYIISVLKQADGRVRGANGAAQLMNIKPTTLESKMAKLKIRREDL